MIWLSLVILVVLVLFYFVGGGSSTPVKQVYIAAGFISVYLLVLAWVPPFPSVTTSHFGGLFGLVPMLSFGAILFPHCNPQSPEVVTRFVGWVGVISVALILACFKLFVW